MSDKLMAIEKLIRSSGHKLTPSRSLIIKLFVESSSHFRPEDIYTELREEDISLPTVYRTIDLLKNLGIIKEINIHNERLYELSIYSGKKLHIHFSCNACGEIKEYVDGDMFKGLVSLREMLEKQYGDHIDDVTVVMSGICEACLIKNT